MIVDDAAGSIKTALNLINKDINQALAANFGSDPLDLEALERANSVLLQLYISQIYKGQQSATEEKIMDFSGPGMNIIRACSEALYYGVASCFSNEMPIHHAIRESLHPCVG